jgi:membrane-bound lytic murein transglycosylase A
MERRRRPVAAVALLILLAAAAAFLIWRMQRAPAPATASGTLTPVHFADLPGWTASDPRAALSAFARSCKVLAAKPAQASLGGTGYAGTAGDWQGVCAAIPSSAASAASARTFFESRFTPVEVRNADKSDALFTGYYEPELFASRKPDSRYRVPIYGVPSDLVSVDLGLFRDDLKGEHLEGCLSGRRLQLCPSRAEIDANGLAQAPILFYADDPVSVFFLHIQGSGRVRLDDGSTVRVAYAGQNGRPYKAVGRTLIEEGLLDRAGMSMQAIRAWMQTHTADARRVMETDQSYVFFQEEALGDPSIGSPGSEGVPLTPGASLAVDLKLHAQGAPFYVAATRPDTRSAKPDRTFDQLLIAQDTGGAIRGPARGDVFWGFGNDAEAIAGRMKSSGRMFVLLPKAVAARLGPHAELRAP